MPGEGLPAAEEGGYRQEREKCVNCRNGGKPIAAVWWRVSTDDQREKLSPETQVNAAIGVLEAQGYTVPPDLHHRYGLGFLELLDAPQFKTLNEWVTTKAVHAVGVYNRDVCQGTGARAYFFAMMQE